MKTFLSAIILLASTNIFSQGICNNNIDFEHGNTSGWSLTSGDINGVTLPCNNCPTGTGGVFALTSLSNSNSTWSSGFDQVTGLSVVAPNGGNFSLALNDNFAAGKIQKAAKTFVVIAADTVLTFNYLPVLQDGGHSPSQQPYFSYYLYDSTMHTMVNGTQLIANVNNTAIPWQTNTAADYLPWTMASINMGSLIGHTVTINFVVSDCNQGGHYGYAYIDALCNGGLAPCGGATPATVCFVTTDDTLHNEVYFNHSPTLTSQQGTVIYRKNLLGSWDSLSTVPITQPDKYIDNAVTAGQSYTYCVAATDSCHTLYGKSAPHSTIFLQSSNGNNGQLNLSWNAYAGIPVSTYKIYRGSSLTSMSLLSQVSSTTFTYTDVSPLVGTDYYKIAISAPGNCTSNASHDTLVESNYLIKNITCNNTITPATNLCFVTTDDSLHNEIYFSHSNTGLKGTIIYRKNALSTWDSIAFVTAAQPDKYIDYGVNPNQQAFTYCIEQIDSCDYHHGKTQAHTTILLQSSLGTGAQVNLSWNAYVGIPVSSYYIYRGSSPFLMSLLAQVSSSTLAYTDLNPLSGNVYYRISTLAPAGCTTNATHDSLVGSNYKVNTLTGISYLANKSEGFYLYPNPAKDMLTVNAEFEFNSMNVYNSLGQVVLQKQSKNKQEQLDVNGLSKGIYFIELLTNDKVYIHKFVKD